MSGDGAGRASLGVDGILTFGALRVRAAFGHGGLRAQKQEGDGATPLGHLPLRRILYRADRVTRPRSAVPAMPIAPHDGWCDDPAHADYNRPVRLPHDAGHEALWRVDGIYDIIGVLGWNDAPVVRNAGSAIFLHVARPDFGPTEGCIALSLTDLGAVLAAGLTSIEVR
ncbi:MAG: L,D-transpeptidase family protein [Gemmatimonadaceae bacterium]|nr:L,D-transpeptidase family protein [Acetobacteraceae bacterium]